MEFKRCNTWFSKSKEGYLVSVAKVNKSFIFTAWAPEKNNRVKAIFYGNAANCYTACKSHYEGNYIAICD